ncbi:MAG: leucine-rich repeat domain-containing protein, partial [Muribaculaceae bacterium]|nr:leucine-rich repeat domain-containing protein [Muribaculaceae bacterium]
MIRGIRQEQKYQQKNNNMKKLLLLLCGLMSLVMSVHAADSKEFDYTHKGKTLKFVILSESERTCAVTGYTSEPVGALELPDCVDYNGIEYSLVEIGRHAFNECSRLTSVEIPNSVTSIEERAFYGCTGLTSIEIPSSVTYLSGFNSCTGLTSIEIPNSVTTIGEGAFYGCTGLTSIEIPNSVTTIE